MNNVIKSNKVEVINNAKTKEVIGDKFVNGLKYEQNKKQKKLDIQGVFVEIGHVRNIDFVKDIIKINIILIEID